MQARSSVYLSSGGVPNDYNKVKITGTTPAQAALLTNEEAA
jgi:hypothetical protein